MEKQPIIEESTTYSVLLYRKSRSLRLWEMGVFLAGFFVLAPFFELRSAPFVVALILWAAVVMTVVPALYRLVYRPRYTLYPQQLVIRFGGKEEAFPLEQVEQTYDLPYIFEIRQKRTPLLVSDAFVEELRTRLEMRKRGLDKHGK